MARINVPHPLFSLAPLRGEGEQALWAQQAAPEENCPGAKRQQAKQATALQTPLVTNALHLLPNFVKLCQIRLDKSVAGRLKIRVSAFAPSAGNPQGLKGLPSSRWGAVQ